jgi:CBS domain-containing protein
MIARLVQELNLRLFERAWQLIAPPDLIVNSCLFVMGSEGRGEQLLKTDQDNGLVIRDGFICSVDVSVICDRFSQALADFGYPVCPGNIMVSNPHWRQSVSDFSQMVSMWSVTASPDSLMELAIFLDAHAVCGDSSLLEQVRSSVFSLTADNDAMLARFAGAINFFGSSNGWWNRLLSRSDKDSDQLDLKKVGTFPLVHGIRSMALAQHLTVVSTIERIEALRSTGKLPEKLAADLVDSLHFFMGLKLKVGLQDLDLQQQISGGIQMEKLSSLDRDLLNDTLDVVKQFKVLLNQRFRLETL